MIDFLRKVPQYLGSRVARNIYLWAFVLTFVLDNGANNIQYSWGIYLGTALATTSIIAAFTYFNNLVLVPRVLIKRRVGLYFLLVTVSAIAMSLVYVIIVKTVIINYPKIDVNDISLISYPVSKSWSATAIADEIQTFLFGFSLWLFIMTMAWYMNDYAKQRRMAEEAKRKQVEAELHLLKSQVNPHFLFNTLNNLYGLALKKSDKSPDAILRLSSILRYLLYESNTERMPFEKEEEVMRAYIDLELLRLPENQDFHFTIHADTNYRIAPLLWLPILENVFKHATRVISDNYYIDYKFIIEKGVIKISSKNNYRSAINGADKKVGGIGLENLKKRLSLLYPGKHSLTFGATDKYYVVELQIQLS